MNDPILISHITLLQLIACVLGVIALFIGKYNKISDKQEASEGSVYSFKKYLSLELYNGIYYLLSALFLLIFVNEVGIYIIEEYLSIPKEIDGAIHYTLAGMSGLFGHKLVNKFI